MKITPQTIDLAVLGLIRECSKPVSLAVLQHLWKARGFRRFDLPVALHRLAARKVLRVEENQETGLDIVVLLPRGRWLERLRPRPRDLLLRLADEWRLLTTRLRPLAGRDSSLRRRAVDLPASDAASKRDRR